MIMMKKENITISQWQILKTGTLTKKNAKQLEMNFIDQTLISHLL